MLYSLTLTPNSHISVLKKGSTPAGMHVSIMVNETIIYMGLNNSSATGGYNIVDCTLGYGG